MPEFVSDHRKNELRSLELHRAITRRLVECPKAVARVAEENLERYRRDVHVLPYVAEWDRLVHGPVQDLVRVMTEDSEYAAAPRQTSPFAGVLSSKERWRVYERFEKAWAHAAR
jgi:hypothetical protein